MIKIIIKRNILLIYGFIFIAFLDSCSLIYKNARQRNSYSNYKVFQPSKKEIIMINSLSVINRISYGITVRNYNKAVIDDTTSSFQYIVKGLNYLKSKGYLLEFINSKLELNDSIYKPFLNDDDFNKEFTYKQMQNLNFKSKQDGIYIIVTVIKEVVGSYGWSGSPSSYHINFIYDFFDVKNGKVDSHSIISKYRRSKYKDWKPLNDDIKKIFNKLYELK